MTGDFMVSETDEEYEMFLSQEELEPIRKYPMKIGMHFREKLK